MALAALALSVVFPVGAGAAVEEFELVKVTDLASLDPLLIDPTGITFISDSGQLAIVDSEIDEEPSLYTGVNMITLDFPYTSASGALAPDAQGRTEPTGLAYDEIGKRLLVTTDGADEVTFSRPGNDGRFGTSDDQLFVPDYTSLGIADLEDVAFGGDTLYLLDGATAEVFEITPGPNGTFDGSSPNGDDQISVLALGALGILDPTGLGYVTSSDSLLVTDLRADSVFEVSNSGAVMRQLDLSRLKRPNIPLTPTDVTLAPASDGSGGRNIFIVDRGADNGDPTDGIPAPQDGRLIEINAEVGSGRFVDDDDSVFQQDIEWIADRAITLGCNPPINDRFCPDEFVTRGQMAAFLVRALPLSDPGTDRFTDDDDSVFEADIQKLAAAGVTLGCNPPTNDRFCPDEFVTRGQMAAFLVRALAYTDPGTDRFTDDDDSVFEADIQKLAAAGVTLGCNPPTNDRFCPDEFVTRGQMAAFLRRALS